MDKVIDLHDFVMNDKDCVMDDQARVSVKGITDGLVAWGRRMPDKGVNDVDFSGNLGKNVSMQMFLWSLPGRDPSLSTLL